MTSAESKGTALITGTSRWPLALELSRSVPARRYTRTTGNTSNQVVTGGYMSLMKMEKHIETIFASVKFDGAF